MIIVQLIGGLGNQMFQYALGRNLSIRTGQPMKLDANTYKLVDPDSNNDIRVYGLNNFNIVAETASLEEISRYFLLYRNKVTRKMWKEYYGRTRKPFYEKPYMRESPEQQWKFNKQVLDHTYRKDVYISGYWQTEKYFKDIRNVLLKELSVQTPPDEKNRLLLDNVKKNNSINVHIRRGNNADPKNMIGLLPLDYYVSAMEVIASRVKDPHFYIFSDDTNWVRSNFPIHYSHTYVGNGENKDYEDMRLMKNCKHHIIANSTFSWWGAWLSENPEKVVIAPKRYIQRLDVPNPDYYPSTWITL